MEVVEAIAEIGESLSEEGQHVAVAKLAEETEEESAHALEKLVIVTAQDRKGLLGDSAKELLGVNLRTHQTIKR